MQRRASLRITLGAPIIFSALLVSLTCSAALPAQPTAAPTTLRILYGLNSCVQLRPGTSLRFSAMTYTDGLYQSIPDGSVTWSSSNPAVLTPPTSGIASFDVVGVGTAEARGVYQGRSAAVVVTVPASSPTPPYLEVSVNTNVARVDLRTSFSAPLVNVTSGATFSSSDTNIATMDGTRVNIQGPIGNFEVRASASNGMAGSCARAVFPRSF